MHCLVNRKAKLYTVRACHFGGAPKRQEFRARIAPARVLDRDKGIRGRYGWIVVVVIFLIGSLINCI